MKHYDYSSSLHIVGVSQDIDIADESAWLNYIGLELDCMIHTELVYIFNES